MANTISKIRVGQTDYDLSPSVENVIGLQTALNAKAGTSVATTKANGLMSSTMVSKLGGIAEGANKTTVDSSLSSSSTNPVQNKVVNSALSKKLATSLKGAANGLAELDASGKVPTSQLPSYVDDVLEYSAKSSFPTTGETGKIYVDTATNKTYRWSGSAYVEISASLALGTTPSTAYYGDKGKVAYEHSQTPHAPSNAEKNQNAFSNVTVGSTTISADSVTDTLNLVAGSNVTITTDASNDNITIAATNTTYSNFVKSGSGAKAGLVPAPSTTAGTKKYLREDGTWAVPPDNNTNYYHTPSYTSANGYKIATGTGVADLYAPAASESTAGLTVVWPAASCTTFSSDSGTVTPKAVQKGAKMFAITRPQKKDSSDPHPGTAETTTDKAIVRWQGTDGDVQDSTIIIEDVTNTRDKSKAQVIAVPASGGKKMVYGYCTDQVDGTSFIGGVFDASATEYPYSAGLAIGGSSGNLLWKGSKVAVTSDIPTKTSQLTNDSGFKTTDNDTKNTAGSTNTSSKIFLVGATSQAANPQTYSHDTAYVGTDGCLYSNSTKVSVNGHKHAAGDITSGTLAVARGGTGVTSNPSMLTNLGSTTAASVFAASPRPGVTGTLPIANGGTGATTAAAALTALGAAPAGHNHAGQNINPSAIELSPGASAGHGGYIDFHYNNSTADCTSRIWEKASGVLQAQGSAFQVPDAVPGTAYARNIICQTTDLVAGTTSMTTGRIVLVYE